MGKGKKSSGGKKDFQQKKIGFPSHAKKLEINGNFFEKLRFTAVVSPKFFRDCVAVLFFVAKANINKA